MFRLSTVLSALAIFLLGIFWFSFLNHRSYPPAPEKKHDSKALLSTSEQVRHRVCKDIWLVDSLGQRLHHRIESDRSLITFHPHGASIEVLEHLFGVRCWIQEKNTTAKDAFQQIRFVLAEEGLYHYRNQSFQAQDVLLSMYKIRGTTFPASLESYSPFLRGTAESILFSLEKGAPKFEASKFKASLGAKAT